MSLQQLSASQANPETIINENFEGLTTESCSARRTPPAPD